MPATIRSATLEDLSGVFDDMRAQLPDNGRDGVWFSTLLPEGADARFTPERLAELCDAVQRPVDRPGWARVFVADDGGRIVGHADLTGGPVATMLHRCTLGIGLQAPYRGQGLGRALLAMAIAWARAAGLGWMDLGVMAGNERAFALYRALGFVEVGRVPDRFRIGDASLTDILMTLRLDGAPAAARAGGG